MIPHRLHICPDSGSPARKPVAVAGAPGAISAQDTRLQLLASLNHEIRTPLSGILGMADLLLETSLDEEQRGYVAAARECAEGLFDLLNTTLEYSSLTSGGLQLDEAEFELPEVLTSAVHEARRKAQPQGVELAWDGAPLLPGSVIGDGYRVRQVFSLLITTALRLGAAGRLEASAIEVADPRPDMLRVSLAVRSEATHLPPWQLEELSAATDNTHALTRRFSELGLSLALLRRLLELMGGQLTLESGAGPGCVLTAELPLWSRAPLPPEQTAEGAALPDERRILVVDDNRISQRVISAILAKGQYAVDCAIDGPAALQMAAGRNYALIFMDLQMPGMDGLEATRRLRQLPGYERTPILALTADVSDDLRLQCRRIGMAAFLNKPVHASDLLEAVEHWLN
jgi:CheY-like chemotaxis protein